MRTKTVSIAESNLELTESKDFVLSFIEYQINNYKLQRLSDWERNRAKNIGSKNDKITSLNDEKVKLKAFFNELNSSNSAIDVNFSIEIKVKEEAHGKVLEYSM